MAASVSICVWLCSGTASGGLAKVEGPITTESTVLGPEPVKRWLRGGVGSPECSIVSVGVWVSMNGLGQFPICYTEVPELLKFILLMATTQTYKWHYPTSVKALFRSMY